MATMVIDGIDRSKWHRPLVGMASTVKNGIDRLRKGKLRYQP